MMYADYRAALVLEAMEWVGTPWRHEGKLKGKAVDCGNFIYEVYLAGGLLNRQVVEHYPKQWALHRSEEKLLEFAYGLGFMEITQPLPGDVIIWRIGRTYSHAALIIDLPKIIHADSHAGIVTLAEADSCAMVGKPFKLLSLFGAL